VFILTVSRFSSYIISSNNILQAVDRNGVAILAQLDLSAAFDTIDNQLLLDHLYQRLTISVTTLHWFSSYLKDGSSVHGWETPLLRQTFCSMYSVSKGSVTLNTHPLVDFITQHQMDYHLYAGDKQLYITFSRHAMPRHPSTKWNLETTSRPGRSPIT
jgi:hypothetical protein